jgi:hypothetical protein
VAGVRTGRARSVSVVYGDALDGIRRRRTVPEQRYRRMAKYGFYVTLGYLMFGRAFSYVGLAPASLFIGEITIVAMFVYRPTRKVIAGLLHQFNRPGRFHILALAIVLFLAYGVLEAVRGMINGGDPVSLVKSLQLHYYTVLLAFGIWLGTTSPVFLEKLAWALAWGNAVYGVAYSAFLNKQMITLPGAAGVPLFDLGLTCSALAVLGLVAYPRKSRWTIPLALANVAVLFGHQIRAEWVSLIVALVVWCLLTRRLRRLMAGLGALLLLLVAVTAANVSLPGPADRGGSVKVGDIIGRALGPISPELAQKYTSESRAQGAAGTADFRQEWWKGIIHSSESNPTTLLFGHGYSFNLQSLAPPGKVDPTVRSPHNLFFYSLGYLGIVGLALLLLYLGTLGVLCWRVYKLTGNPIGLVILLANVVSAQFEPWLESPFGAAACYLLVGICLAPLASTGPHAREMVRYTGPPKAYHPGPPPRLPRPAASRLRRPPALARVP